MQRKLLETNKLYNSNDYYHNCYTLIYEIRKKINSKYIKIAINVNPHVIDNIKNGVRKFEKYNNINYLEQEDFNNFKNDLKSIYNKFTKEYDFNFEESMFYDNLLYLQSFIIEDIRIWEIFTKFLMNNREHYYKYDKIEDLIFENLFEYIDKNNFNFDFFIDNLILLYNSIIEKPYKDGIIPNETLIHNFLDRIISILSKLNIHSKFYTRIYNSINNLNFTIKKEIQKSENYQINPFKIKKELNKKDDSIKYIISDLEGDNEESFFSIEKIIDHIDNNYIIDSKVSDISLSRILYFKYLLKDINNRCLTIAHPSSFEHIKERVCKFSNKFYICCFSKTTDSKDEYAWWKIYGQVPNDKFENIKIRINFNKRNLIKNLLKDKNSDYIYYFGDIDYSMPKDNNKANTEIKDFFYKSYAFKFEDEFRVLIKCKNSNDKNIIYNNKNEPHLLKLPVNINLYRSIKVNKNSFNPYKHLKINTKTKIKDILIAYQNRYIRKNKKHIKNFCNKFITVIRRYVNVYKNKKEK